MDNIVVSQEFVQIEYAYRLPSILVLQEFVQVEYSDRLPSLLVLQEFVQVEYVPMSAGTKDLGSTINGCYEREPEYTYVKSTREFDYFDVQVDFTICSGVDTTMCGVELVFEIDDNNKFYIRAGSFLSNMTFMCNFIDDGVVNFHTVSGTNTYGKLRISRNYGTAIVYYKDGSAADWTLWKEYYIFKSGKGNILLGFNSAGSFNSSVNIDNFIVNSNKLCSTCYFYDNFYGEDGDLYNSNLWSGSTSNIEIKNNKLHMLYGNSYNYVEAKYAPIGDFNVQVDFSIGNYQSYCCWSQGLVVYFGNGNSFHIRYLYDSSSSPYRRYITSTHIDGVWTTHASYGSDIMSGKFRITKIGNIFSSYFFIMDKWFHLCSWYLEEELSVDSIRLEQRSWSSVPSFECYFDNFKINNDVDFYNDVMVDGDHSYIGGNYLELLGGVIRTNKPIYSANSITFEWSITIENETGNYNDSFVVCNTPFRNSYSDNSGESVCLVYEFVTNLFMLYVDGDQYGYIFDSSNKLFYPEHGKTYTIGIKLIPETGVIIYWQGPTSGYFIFDYIINGCLYSWWGSNTGYGDRGDLISIIHNFRCFEDKQTYKELINGWMFSNGVNDFFELSDGRTPDNERWAIAGDPRIYNHSLKIVGHNQDKIQSRIIFHSPFEVVVDYNSLSFNLEENLALSLNIEYYGIYKDGLFGTSKFKVGYKNGGLASWVNYYCNDSTGTSSVYSVSDLTNKKLKVINNGYRVQYLLSDGDGWITILSQNCDKQYYYKVSIEGTGQSVIAFINSITFDYSETATPTDAVALVPTAWRFSPTDKAYQDIVYVPFGEIVDRERFFSIDAVVKIDNSMFLSYIEIDKDLVTFNGAKVVGDNYSTLTSAITDAEDGEIIYVLPGTYSIGGYTINKKVIIIGVGDYSSIILTIDTSVKLDGCYVIFKNVTITESLPYHGVSFITNGDEVSYFTMDNCKYITNYSNRVYVFKVEGTQPFYVYLRRCYLSGISPYGLASIGPGYPYIYFDIFNCRINVSRTNLLQHTSGYQIRSEIYSDSSKYEPVITDNVPVVTLFSPADETDIYLSTPNGMEKKITCKENEFNYISFGNELAGAFFSGAKNEYYLSEYFIPKVDSSFKLFIQGYIDTIRVFNRYLTYNEIVNNINTVGGLGTVITLAHNTTIVDYKVYEPLNQYNTVLKLGKNTPSVVDEFIWSGTETSPSDMLSYYNSYLGKLGYFSCNINIESIKYKFLIDLASSAGIGYIVQTIPNNFSDVAYYSDVVDDPNFVETSCSLSEARWYELSSFITQNIDMLTPGVFSIFPSISGCDSSRWKYTGENGYTDVVYDSVLDVSSTLTDVYNIKWQRNKTDINDYMISIFSDSLTISLKLFGGGTCDRIVIKSGYNIGSEYAGYITKCSILIDSVVKFTIDDNINSIIVAEFDSVEFTDVELVIHEVKQVSGFSFGGELLVGNVVFVNYMKVLSFSAGKKFDKTICNVHELYNPFKLESIETSKVGACVLDDYSSTSYMDECVSLSSLDLDDMPDTTFTSILSKSDGLYDCSFTVDSYVVDILSEVMTGSMDSWKVYVGDVELYEEFFYISGGSTSIGGKFFKSTIFEIGTYYENFGMYLAWSITDEVVLKIYSSDNIDNFYLCIGNKEDGRYYRWDFSLVSGWNNLRFNFYGSNITKYVSNTEVTRLLFNDLDIFNVWFGGIYQHSSGFVVLDTIFIDKSSVKNVLTSKNDAVYIPVYYESDSGAVEIDYTTYWDNKGNILGNILSNKTLLSVFGDELSFSLVNKISGKFVLGVYSPRHDTRTVKEFGRAGTFNTNDKLKIKLNWKCNKGYFISELYIDGIMVGKVDFNFIEIDKLKVTGILIGGSGVYITSIYNSLSLCGQLNYIKIYSSDVESKLTDDRLFIKHGGEYKNLVENSPIELGEIQPAGYVKLPVRYEGKSKKLNQLNLRVKWVGNY